MTKYTKKHSVISFIFLGITTTVFLLALYIVQSRGGELRAGYETMQKQQLIQQQQIVIENVIEMSADERTALNDYFLEERGIIGFISNIETQASVMRVLVETTQLAVEPIEESNEDGANSTLKIGFSFTGTEPAVVRFMEYLETLPYYKEIPSAVIAVNDTDNSNNWEGTIILHLMITP